MKSLYSRYVEHRRRKIANERDELTSKIAAMIPEVEAIAKNSPDAETRHVAQKWLALEKSITVQSSTNRQIKP